MAARIMHGLQIFEQFQSVPTIDQSCEIMLKLAQRFRRKYCLKKFVNSRIDGIRRRTVSDHNSLSIAQVS